MLEDLPWMDRFVGALAVRCPAVVRWYRWNHDRRFRGAGVETAPEMIVGTAGDDRGRTA
jgi:hypothetical protein